MHASAAWLCRALEGRTASISKVRQLLGIEGPPPLAYPYGLGSQRALRQFWEFAGIELATNSTNLLDDTLCKWPGGAEPATVCEPLFLVQDRMHLPLQQEQEPEGQGQQNAAAAGSAAGSSNSSGDRGSGPQRSGVAEPPDEQHTQQQHQPESSEQGSGGGPIHPSAEEAQAGQRQQEESGNGNGNGTSTSLLLYIAINSVGGSVGAEGAC